MWKIASNKTESEAAPPADPQTLRAERLELLRAGRSIWAPGPPTKPSLAPVQVAAECDPVSEVVFMRTPAPAEGAIEPRATSLGDGPVVEEVLTEEAVSSEPTLPIAMLDMSDCPLSDNAAVATAPTASSRQEAPSAKDAAAADAVPFDELERLPGVGPGLIWLLNSHGIETLTDLASADPSELTGRLNLIGQIVDVNAWIEFAQTAKPAEG